MDEHTPSRRERATAGASALGSAALLVLSFGPSALALSPSSPAPQSARVAVSTPAPGSATSAAGQRPDGEDDAREASVEEA